MCSVIGIYLAQGLKGKIHHGHVFRQSMLLLSSHVRGAFSPEEDRVIIEEVEKNGECLSTWKEICAKLDRNLSGGYNFSTIRTRYKEVLKIPRKSGAWTFEEDQCILQHLFKDSQICSIDKVKSIRFNDFKNLKEINRPPSNINTHWEHAIKPALLLYHLGPSHSSSKERFLKYILDVGVEQIGHIDWKEVLEKFPSETHKSLVTILSNINRKKKNSKSGERTLKTAINEYIQNENSRKSDDTQKKQKYYENIVSCYTNIFKQ